MEMLSEAASGLRHLRWAREIQASLEAHARGEGLLQAEAREALGEEAARLRELVQKLSGAVKPYRDFLERTRVHFRASQRAARFAVLSGHEPEAARLEEVEEAFARMEREQRLPLKAALREVIAELRAWLLAMNERIRSRIPDAEGLLESLYPPLAGAGERVADVEDNDDDATAPPVS
jgi:hypothetical protein